MSFNLHQPDWHLNYPLAALGAYASVVVQLTCLTFGDFENATPLSISLVTNGSTLILAGFDSYSSYPLAILRIFLTTIFLLYAIVASLTTEQAFDGTYAILCGVAYLAYAIFSQSQHVASDPMQGQHAEKKTEAPAHIQLDNDVRRYAEALTFQRKVVFQFGDTFQLDGGAALLSIFGTALVYRAFDFDFGFSSVFAFFSAVCCTNLLFLINFVRLHDRHIDIMKVVQRLLGLLLPVGVFCFLVFTYVDFGINTSWSRVAFGVVWCVFLL